MVLDEDEHDEDEEEEDYKNIYDTDDSWVPEESVDEYDEDNWSDNPDES
jgi:hypothetical protein